MPEKPKTNPKTKPKPKLKTKTTKKPVGRPPIHKTVTSMQTAIDRYFTDCEGEKALDENGLPVMSKFGAVFIKEPRPPTITGLALALGFSGRQSFVDYSQKSKEFSDTIVRAKSRIEDYACSRLYDKDGATGAKFYLTSAFGYRGDTAVNVTSTVNTAFSQFSTDDLQLILTQAQKELETG